MVEAEAYLASCRRAFGPGVLCKTEVTVLRTMTDSAGWFAGADGKCTIIKF